MIKNTYSKVDAKPAQSAPLAMLSDVDNFKYLNKMSIFTPEPRSPVKLAKHFQKVSKPKAGFKSKYTFKPCDFTSLATRPHSKLYSQK